MKAERIKNRGENRGQDDSFKQIGLNSMCLSLWER